MSGANLIRWRKGEGWLVLSGGGDFSSGETGDIEAQALGLAPVGQPIAYIWAAGDVEAADRHLAALEEMGAPTGYLVDVLTEDDDTLRTQLGDAAMIIVGEGPALETLRSGLLGAAHEAIISAYEHGAVVLGIGQGAAIFGSILPQNDGLGWLERAAIIPGYERAGRADQMRALLLAHPDSYGLGIESGSAVALGPNGVLEVWGRRQITVTLGHSFA